MQRWPGRHASLTRGLLADAGVLKLTTYFSILGRSEGIFLQKTRYFLHGKSNQLYAIHVIPQGKLLAKTVDWCTC